jgi:hypothetical protein
LFVSPAFAAEAGYPRWRSKVTFYLFIFYLLYLLLLCYGVCKLNPETKPNTAWKTMILAGFYGVCREIFSVFPKLNPETKPNTAWKTIILAGFYGVWCCYEAFFAGGFGKLWLGASSLVL